jgi:hypothetical protein
MSHSHSHDVDYWWLKTKLETSLFICIQYTYKNVDLGTLENWALFFSFIWVYACLPACVCVCVLVSNTCTHTHTFIYELRLTKKKTSCHTHACMLQLCDVTRIDRKIAQARYMYTYTLTFISILHDDQSTEIQTSSFAFCLFVITIDLSMIVTFVFFIFYRSIVLVIYGMSTNPICFH